jgi:WD40 repeat protein/serine/threonine protein kinase
MPVDRLPSFLDALRASGLLTQRQLEELAGNPKAQAGDPVPLARELVQRGWLTKYQASAMLQGRGKDLVLGPYRILDSLGEGGMGQVFKAHHQLMKRVVALKVIRKEKLANPETVRRFYAEVSAAAQLAHPNIVLAFDAGEVGSVHYFAMEYVEGFDLARLVKQSGPPPVWQACDFIRQAALGLQHAHECGLIHRDIKPANLLVTRWTAATDRAKSGSNAGATGQRALVKILDMGLARLEDSSSTAKESGATQEGKLLGTPDYLAPEQARDAHRADVRSDLYSLGCTFYYLLTGQPPFRGKSVMEVLLKHQMDPPPPLQQLRPEVPPPVAAIVSRLMAKRPEERYASAAEVALALEPFCRETGGAAGASSAIQGHSADGSGMDWAHLFTDRGNDKTEHQLEDNTFATAVSGQSVAAKSIAKKTKRKRGWLIPVVGTAVGVNVIASIVFAFVLYRRANQPQELPPETPVQIVVVDAPKDPGTDAKVINPRSPVRPDEPAPKPPPERRTTEVALEVDGSRVFTGHKGPVHCAVFSRDGRFALSGGADMVPRLWDLEAGKTVQTYSGHTSPVWSVALSARRAVSAAADSTIRLWDLASGKELHRFVDEGQSVGPTYALAFSPDGARLLSGGADKRLRLWDVESGKVISRLDGHTGTILSLAVSLNGGQAASGGTDGTLRLWDLANQQPLHTFGEQQGAVTSVWFSRPGGRLVSANQAGSLQIYDLKTKSVVWNGRVPVNEAATGRPLKSLSVALSPDSRYLVSGGEDQVIRLWGVTAKRVLYSLEGHKGPVTSVAFSPDGKRVLSTAMDNTMRLWPVPRLPDLARPAAPKPPVPPREILTKGPPPDETKQAEAKKRIEQEYNDDYLKKTPADKLALAAKLFDRAADGKDDPVIRFVLLREMRDLAAQAGDPSTVMAAIAEMSFRYTIPAAHMRMAALTEASQAGNTMPGTARALAEAALVVFGEAMAGDQFDLAQRALTLADTAVKRAPTASLLARLQARTKDLGDSQKEAEAIKPAAETLQKKRADPEANLLMGKYLAFRKGLWDKALPMLAIGSDATLAALAKEDLAKPVDAVKQVELGDRWWDVAQAEQGMAKTLLQERAAFWYRQAETKVAEATQARIKKRIDTAFGELSLSQGGESIGQLRRCGGHASKVTSVALSRDGRRALSGADGMLKLWDVATGKEIRQFPAPAGEVRSLAFSPDGTKAISAHNDGVWLWDVDNGQQIRRFFMNGVECCAFFADGRRVVAGASQGRIFTWYTEDGRIGTTSFNSNLGVIHCLAVSPDDRLVVFVPDDGKVHLLDLRTEILGRPLDAKTAVLSLAFAPNGNSFLTGSVGRSVRSWDLKGHELKYYKGHTGRVTSVAYSGDGRYILSGSDDKTVRLWDAKTGYELQRFALHTDKVTSVALAADGRRAVSGGNDKTMRVWALPR